MLPSVLILSPTYESSYGPARDSIVNFAAQYAEQGGRVRMRSVWRSSNIGEARTALAQSAMTTDYDMVLWVDSDNAFTPDQASKIVKQAHEHKTIVGALYRSRNETLRFVCEPRQALLGNEQGLESVYWVGFGLAAMPMAIIRSVFDKFERYAFFTRDASELGTVIPKHIDIPWGEDIAFCRHWLMMGHEVFVDTSTRIGHIGPTIFNL